MGNTDIGMYPKKIECPVEGCKHWSKTQEGLTHHLYIDHPKNQLAATIVVLMDLVDDLQTQLKDIKWRHRGDV